MATFRGRHGYDYFNPTYSEGGESDGLGLVIPRVNRAPSRPQSAPAMGSTFELKMLPGGLSPQIAAPAVSAPLQGPAPEDTDAQRNAIVAAMMTANPVQHPAEGYGSESPSGVVGGYPLDPNLDQNPHDTPVSHPFDAINPTGPAAPPGQQAQPGQPTQAPNTGLTGPLSQNVNYAPNQPYNPEIDIATVPAKGQPVTEVVDENQYSVVDQQATPIVDQNQYSVVDALATPNSPMSQTAAEQSAKGQPATEHSGPNIGYGPASPTPSVTGQAIAPVAAPEPVAPDTPIGVAGNNVGVGKGLGAIGTVSGPVIGQPVADANKGIAATVLGMLGVTQPLGQTIDNTVNAVTGKANAVAKGVIDSLMDVTGQQSLANQALNAMTAPNIGWTDLGTQDPVAAALDAMSAAPDMGSFGVGFGGTSDIGFGAQADADAATAASQSFGTDPGTGMATGTGTGYGGGDIGAGFGPSTADGTSYGGAGFGAQADADAAAAAASGMATGLGAQADADASASQAAADAATAAAADAEAGGEGQGDGPGY